MFPEVNGHYPYGYTIPAFRPSIFDICCELPDWNDALRGILLALVEKNSDLWDASSNVTKDRCITLCKDIALLLNMQDNRITVWSVLEKWCWMMEMYSRSKTDRENKWRYAGAMSFLDTNADNGMQYIGCLTPDRFDYLTKKYAKDETEVLLAQEELPSVRKASAYAPWFEGEMYEYSSISQNGVVKRRKTPRLVQDELLPVKDEPVNEPFFHPKEGMQVMSSEEISTKCVPPHDLKTEVEEQEMGIGDTGLFEYWTPDMENTLIEAVKNEPVLWMNSHIQFRSTVKRRECLTRVAAIVRAVSGAETINEDQVSARWSMLRECFNTHNKKAKTNGNVTWEHFESLKFLDFQTFDSPEEQDVYGEDRMDRSPDISHILSNVYKNPGAIAAKRMKLEKAIKWNVKTAATWVPPKEDSVGAAMLNFATTSHQPATATAQITTTSSNTTALTSLLRGEAAPQKQSKVASSSSRNGYRSAEPPRPENKDKWVLTGELVEQTCRELEEKSPELAIHLQKEITDILFKYQLRNIGK